MPRNRNENMLTPVEAAKYIGCGPDLIKYSLRTDQFPVGTAIKNEENGRWSYLIPREAFFEWLKHYQKTLPVRIFERWKVGDDYIIPCDELRKTLLNRAKIDNAKGVGA